MKAVYKELARELKDECKAWGCVEFVPSLERVPRELIEANPTRWEVASRETTHQRERGLDDMDELEHLMSVLRETPKHLG